MLASSLAVAGIIACGSGATGPEPGSLIVKITAPKVVTPSVTVTGPAGYSRVLGSTTMLSGLAAGTYTITAKPFTSTDPVVGSLYAATISGSPATVTTTTGAAATASYAQRAGSGGLWLANGGNPGFVAEYTSAKLATQSPGGPSITLTVPGNPAAPTADANGNLWVPLLDKNAIVEYTVAQLVASGSPTPAVTIGANAGSLNAPAVLAFDANGNLWVANSGNEASAVVEFTASQIASSGSPLPAVALTSFNGSLNKALSLAFDAHGDLWVGTLDNTDIVESHRTSWR